MIGDTHEEASTSSCALLNVNMTLMGRWTWVDTSSLCTAKICMRLAEANCRSAPAYARDRMGCKTGGAFACWTVAARVLRASG